MFLSNKDLTAAPDVEVTNQATVVEQILDRVLPRWCAEVPSAFAHNRSARHREGALRVRDVFVREREVKKSLGGDAPEISAVHPHPWAWSGAASPWASGHFRKAVRGAARKLNAETQLDGQVAIEYLAALSVLARWVDESTVEHAGGAA